jgi:uncharacterized protein
MSSSEPCLSDFTCTLASLHVYPIKSCGGVNPLSAVLSDTGLDYDRAWMLVDAAGDMLTQRDLPRMALVATRFRVGELELRAPGMLALNLKLDTVEAPTRARVWNDEVPAYDMGALAGQWFTDFLKPDLAALPGIAAGGVRLVRFDPEHRRLSSARWTAGLEAANQFSDGYPLLVAGTASLADLNQRLAARGQAAVGMDRFRANLVLDGLSAWEEDHIDTFTVSTDDGPVVLRMAKPCVRCEIPNVDPATAAAGHEPGDTLAGFRADTRVNGGITFGMNAVIVSGVDRTLRVGQAVQGTLKV